MKPIKIKWVLAHEPVELFIRAAEKFKEVMDERAPGRVEVDIILLSDYIDSHNKGEYVNKHDILDHVADGRIQMSQLYTYTLAKLNPNLYAFDLPFLFKDHDHAARVFEGPIGQKMLDGYNLKGSKIQGLAFTYSGGYKQIGVNKHIENLSEIVNSKFRVSPSPVSVDTFATLGTEPVKCDIEQMAEVVRSGQADGGELGWPRLYALNLASVTKTIIETDHSLLLTNIIINKEFLESVPEDLKPIMMEAAMEAGRHEREISIADVEPTAERAIADGIKIIKLSQEERKQFETAAEKIYEKFDHLFEDGLIDSIRTA